MNEGLTRINPEKLLCLCRLRCNFGIINRICLNPFLHLAGNSKLFFQYGDRQVSVSQKKVFFSSYVRCLDVLCFYRSDYFIVKLRDSL